MTTLAVVLTALAFVPSNSVPVVGSECGKGVAGPAFHVYACMSGGARAGHPHPKELLLVRRDGSSIAYPAFRVGRFAVGDEQIVVTYDISLVRVTSSRLIPLVTAAELASALHIRVTTIADMYATSVDGRGDVYFSTSLLSRAGCQNRRLERMAGGTIRQLWASSTSRDNTCG